MSGGGTRARMRALEQAQASLGNVVAMESGSLAVTTGTGAAGATLYTTTGSPAISMYYAVHGVVSFTSGRFTAPPRVFLSFAEQNTAPADFLPLLRPLAMTITSEGFLLVSNDLETADVTITWLAVQIES